MSVMFLESHTLIVLEFKILVIDVKELKVYFNYLRTRHGIKAYSKHRSYRQCCAKHHTLLYIMKVTKSFQIIEEIVREASANAVSQLTEYVILLTVLAIVDAYWPLAARNIITKRAA